jgi:hypothetical protein
MTYACPTSAFAADTHLMKLQCLENRVLCAIGNLDRRTEVRDFIWHSKFRTCETKFCRRQAEVILHHENPNVHAIGQGEARQRKHKRLKLGGGQFYDRSSV